MGEQVGDRYRALRSLAAATAGLCGVTAASAAVAWDAAIGTHPDRLGPLGSISLSAALGAVALGITALITGERRPRRVAITAVGAGLGLLTLGWWFSVMQSILEST
jgi:hypothetical protein